MRFALALMVVMASSLQAVAQGQSDRRLFTSTDYEAYFTEGSFSAASPTQRSLSLQQHSIRGGKTIVTYFEVMPKWGRASPYPFVKIKGRHELRLGVFDKKLNARVYQLRIADFESKVGEVWLSRDKRMSISPSDVSAGSMRDHNMATASAAGRNPEDADAAYLGSVVGDWMVRCAFVKAASYEVECVNQHVESGYRIIWRYTKRTGMS